MRWFLILLILFSISSISEETRSQNIKKFNAAQKCFKEAGAFGNKKITCAQNSLDIGLLIFNDSSQTIISLTHNLAKAYPRLSSERFNLLERALKLAEKHYGSESTELVDLLMDIANEESENRYINKRYKRVAVIYSQEVGEESLDYADLCLDISEEVVSYLNTKGRLRTSSRYAEVASEIYMQRLGSSSDGYGMANLRLAKNQLAIKKQRKAIPYLVNALDSLVVSKYARAFLVKVYEDIDEPALAASYLLGPDKKVRLNKNSPYEAVYKNMPGAVSAYNSSGTSQGWARVEYTITKLGVTDGLRVIDGSSNLHKRKLLEAVSEWRFTPAYIDGNAVDTIGVVQTYNWTVHER